MKIDDIAKQLANKVNQEHYIKHYLEKVQRGAYKKGVKDAEAKQFNTHSVSSSLSDYEYEMFIDDERTPFEINSWIPITSDRIKDQTRIDEYITKGFIRKRQK